MPLKLYSGLSFDFSSMLKDADDYNVIIQIGENPNVKEFRAHSNILRARSPYFKSAFSTRWTTKNNDLIEFKKPNITHTVFEMALNYMYTGEVDLSKQSGKDILELLVASDELMLDELLGSVQDYLIKEQAVWIKQNFVLVLHTIFKLSNCKKLCDYCLESICTDPEPFFTSKGFPSLDKDILYVLLKRDDLQIEETIIWDNLIKWGIEQTTDLKNKNKNRSNWNHKDYEELKRTLSKFVPLIRFSEISSADFFDKVRPYKAVIPNHIYEEVMEYYMKGSLPKTTTLPPRIGKIQVESNIIKSRVAHIITNWINKKDATTIRDRNDSRYNFDRVYQGSQSGTDHNTFRSNCTQAEPILVIVKCQGSHKIFGGYSPFGFYNNSNYGNQWINSADSFIFSFENDNLKDMKLCRVSSNCYAVYNNSYSNSYGGNYYGFNFGHELYTQNQQLYLNSSNGYYENNMNENNNYTIEEIEAFKVVKQ